MRKIIFILALISCSMVAHSQTLNPFPTTDSLRKFINKWIRNSAVDAFTNLRLNTSLIGMTRFLDSTYGGQVSSFTYSADTLRLGLLDGTVLKVSLPAATGNSNQGAGFRLLIPSSQGIKTIFAGNTVLIDSSSNTNGLTWKVDTSVIATLYDISLKADQQAFIDSIAALRSALGSGAVNGDLTGNLPNPRLAHTVQGTGSFVQVKNNVVVGDTIARLGTVFTDNFARASLGSNYSTSGTQTVSFPSSAYMQLSGSLDFTNRVYRNDYTAVNRWIDTVRFTTGTPGGSTFGLVLGVFDQTGYVTGVTVQFGTATGGVTNIYLRFEGGAQIVATAAPQTISGGDSLMAIVQRIDNRFICTYKNITTGATPTVLDHTFSTLTSVAQPSPAAGRMFVGTIGGTQNVSYWSHTSDEVKYQTAVIGDSRYSGGYAATTIQQSAPDLLFPSRDQWARLGGAGDRSSDAINYIPQLLTMAPRTVIYALGVNDALNSVTGATFSANVQRVFDSLLAHGTSIIVMELPPSTSPTKPYSDTLAAIAARKGLTYVTGPYNAMKSGGTTFNSAYSADGVHENDSGMIINANFLRPYLSATNYNLTALGIPSDPDSAGSEKLTLWKQDGSFLTGVLASTLQIIGKSVRVGTLQQTFAGNVPGLSVSWSEPNGFPIAFKNLAANGWSGYALFNNNGNLRYAAGWAGTGTTTGLGRVADSSMLYATFGVTTGRHIFLGGDNNATNAVPDFEIGRGYTLMSYHNAAARPVSPRLGMTYFDIDSLEHVTYIASTGAWVRQSRLGFGASLTTNQIGVGASGLLSGSSAFTYDGTTVKQENATAAHSITSTTALGSTSGGDFRVFAKATPTAGDQRMGGLMFGTLDGGSTENLTAGIEAFSTAAQTPGSSEQTHLRFSTTAVATKTEVMRITANLRVGIGTTTIPSTLTLGSGNASVNPFAFTNGTRMTTPTNGSWAWDAGVLLFTPSGNTYKRPALVNDVAPSNGQIPVGNGTDFTAATLTQGTGISITNGSGSITVAVPTSFASSATYSPSTTLTTNVASATVNAASYSRQGSIITFSLDVTVDPTSIGLVEVGIAFPSGIDNIVNTYDVRGTANTNDVDLENGTVRADVGNQRMILRFTATNTGARTYSVSGQYTYSAP